jgi:GNAT superfamily N-acetyltransferase
MIEQIKLLSDPKEIQKVYAFVKQFPLDYPDYFQWLEKCRRELELGYKHAFYVINSKGLIIGSIIFQQHKRDGKILEIKNLRVDPQFEQQGLWSLLEAMTELYARDQGYRRIQGDAHPENLVVDFMQKRGYKVESQATLYTAKKEIVLVKDL